MDNFEELRVIKTARDQESINKAARQGFFPLVKAVKPSEKIRSKFAVYQDQETGEIEILGDYRAGGGNVIGFTFYYPHAFPNPFAAYLIPGDLKAGEKVFLEDLIEDRISHGWNQGDVYRQMSSRAIWDGKDFRILDGADPNEGYAHRCDIVLG